MKVVRDLRPSELEYLSNLRDKAQEALDRANEYRALLQEYVGTLTEEGQAIDLNAGVITTQDIEEEGEDELPEDEE